MVLALVLVSSLLVLIALVVYLPKHGILARRAQSGAAFSSEGTPAADYGAASDVSVDAITGQPQACASMTGIPKPSK